MTRFRTRNSQTNTNTAQNGKKKSLIAASFERGLGSCLSMNVFNLQSRKTQLLITALSASAATACLFSLYTTYSRIERRRNLDRDVKRSLNDTDDSGTTLAYGETKESRKFDQPHEEIYVKNGTGYDEELIREQLARNYAFFGDDAMNKIRGGTVVVVGCGGVGSWAAVMLVRS